MNPLKIGIFLVSALISVEEKNTLEYNFLVEVGGGDLLCVGLHHDVAVDEDGADDGE